MSSFAQFELLKPEITFERPNGSLSENAELAEKWPDYGAYRCTATNILGQSSMIKEIGGIDLIAIGRSRNSEIKE